MRALKEALISVATMYILLKNQNMYFVITIKVKYSTTIFLM